MQISPCPYISLDGRLANSCAFGQISVFNSILSSIVLKRTHLPHSSEHTGSQPCPIRERTLEAVAVLTGDRDSKALLATSPPKGGPGQLHGPHPQTRKVAGEWMLFKSSSSRETSSVLLNVGVWPFSIPCALSLPDAPPPYPRIHVEVFYTEGGPWT